MNKDSEQDSKKDIEALIERFAIELAKRRLETPAILFLELHKPFTTVGYNALLFAAPLLSPFCGGKLESLQELFKSRDRVESLISKIEEEAQNRDSKASASVKEQQWV